MTDIASVKAPVQIESTQVNAPVSESLSQTMGASINFSIKNAGQVGDVVMSLLDTTNFQLLRDTSWVLLDGSSCAGTEFETLTGLSALPDFRGRYARMKDNGAAVDPHGDLALGTLYADQFASHQHPMSKDPSSGFVGARLLNGSGSASANTGVSGGSETNPKTGIVNFFVKVNT